MLKLIDRFRPIAGYFLAVTVILILLVSSIPNIPTLKIHTARSDIRIDYLIHFCEYGFLGFLTFLTFAGDEFRIPARRFFLIVLGVFLFAIADEYHQKFIPGRTFNPKDLISNFSGIVFAVIFSIIVFKKIYLKKTR